MTRTRELPTIAEGDGLFKALMDQVQAQHMSRYRLAKSADLSPSLVYRCRHPSMVIRQDTWVRMARALGCRWTLTPDTRLIRLSPSGVHRLLLDPPQG